jgi:hypothetical protein
MIGRPGRPVPLRWRRPPSRYPSVEVGGGAWFRAEGKAHRRADGRQSLFARGSGLHRGSCADPSGRKISSASERLPPLASCSSTLPMSISRRRPRSRPVVSRCDAGTCQQFGSTQCSASPLSGSKASSRGQTCRVIPAGGRFFAALARFEGPVDACERASPLELAARVLLWEGSPLDQPLGSIDRQTRAAPP